MPRELMSFNKFKQIMTTLQEFMEQRDRIDKFFEKEITKDSYCMFTLGNPLLDTITRMLADEFDCWFTYQTEIPVTFEWADPDFKSISVSNDIEEWLYAFDKPTTITVNGKEIDISTLEKFYTYLASEYYKKHAKEENLT